MHNNDTDLSLQSLAAELGSALAARQWKVTTAESCTGGAVSAAITQTPGSSNWFEVGFVTYADKAKQQLLGVNPAVLSREGAVSASVVTQMVQGARKASGADIAVAVSGIAGPGGGSQQKPVGTVWFAWGWGLGQVRTECYVYEGDREAIRRQACITAMRELLQLSRTTK